MRLTKCQEHALMFLYFWNYFTPGRGYWYEEDCIMKRITVESLVNHGLFDSWNGELYLEKLGDDIAKKKWIKNDKWRPLFLKMNAVYGDGAP